jgi:uridine monophosphate synthetase
MLSYLKRAHLTKHPLAQKLFNLMDKKRTNLCVAADVVSQKQLLALADLLGPEICVLKTHVDILEDYTPDLGAALRQLAHKHQFFLFEDRKFADIGQTVSLQYEKGIYHISEWADLINAHPVPGPGIIEGLKQVGQPLGRGLLLIAEMSSAGTMAKGSYAKKTVAMGEAHSDFVLGFIAQQKLTDNPAMIHFTPGVKMHAGKDSLGQRYRTVEDAICKQKTDVIIVGRDITNTADPLASAKMIRQTAWGYYKQQEFT